MSSRVKYTRTIEIVVRRGEFADNTALMLAFKPNGSTHDAQYPICWKTAEFSAKEPGSTQVIYENQLVFGYPGMNEEGTVVEGLTTWSKIDPDYKTSLTQKDDHVRVFTDPPVKGQTDAVSVENMTDDHHDIALGFILEGHQQIPTPMIMFDNIDAGSTVAVEFVPKVSAYVTSRYRRGAVLRDPIKTPADSENPDGVETPEIWSANLADLKEHTLLMFTKNPVSGVYSLKRAMLF
ncbi:hypothetical protein FRC17_010446 [Serendipita sp. 399]|nr:hypothetical protein FRC17_010446 [Serendipita sp. 399]